jgi:hypothetical protein
MCPSAAARSYTDFGVIVDEVRSPHGHVLPDRQLVPQKSWKVTVN